MEGRVEVCTSYNIWGAVCNKQWTPSHTRVVCRNLGYSDSEGIILFVYCEYLSKYKTVNIYTQLCIYYISIVSQVIFMAVL